MSEKVDSFDSHDVFDFVYSNSMSTKMKLFIQKKLCTEDLNTRTSLWVSMVKKVKNYLYSQYLFDIVCIILFFCLQDYKRPRLCS